MQRRSVIFFCGLLFCFGAAAQTTASAARTADSIAILTAIETESRNFYKKDHQAWSRSYAHRADVFWLCVESDVTLRAKGWTDLSQFVAAWMKENPKPMDYDAAQFRLRNVQMDIHPHLAIVRFEGSNLQEDGKTLRRTVGSRTLVKEGGDWKILAMCSYPDDAPRGSTPNVYVHGR